MGGLLPFGSIFIEMYFVFTSFWNYKVNKQVLSNIFVLLDIASLTTVILYCKGVHDWLFFNFPLAIPNDVHAS
jgi:hypothetical protein